MDYRTHTPSIQVAIGRDLRLYHAYVTTAPTTLDAPATLTLYTASLADVSGMAAEAMAFDAGSGKEPGRLVLVDTRELAWQRARCREARHVFAPADPVLISLNTLQQWLWRRISAVPQPEHELVNA